ncbi:MAG: hypothetical protein Q4B50_00195 [Bacillota bacterium]|nr:hypothetical protein [Bacillota bacterium]
MKKLAALLLCCCLFLSACGSPQEEAPADPPEVSVEGETENDVEPTPPENEEPEESGEADGEEGVLINPLPVDIDINNLTDCTVAVSIQEGGIYLDDDGAMQMDVEVFIYEYYDMVDIATMKEGDTILLRQEEVLVESLEQDENGRIFINGGIEAGGYELTSGDGSGIFFESGMNDHKYWQSIGSTTLRVNGDEFVYSDQSDLEKGEVTYLAGDFLQPDSPIEYDFNPNNTQIVIQDGQIIAMIRVYIP